MRVVSLVGSESSRMGEGKKGKEEGRKGHTAPRAG